MATRSTRNEVVRSQMQRASVDRLAPITAARGVSMHERLLQEQLDQDKRELAAQAEKATFAAEMAKEVYIAVAEQHLDGVIGLAGVMQEAEGNGDWVARQVKGFIAPMAEQLKQDLGGLVVTTNRLLAQKNFEMMVVEEIKEVKQPEPRRLSLGERWSGWTIE